MNWPSVTKTLNENQGVIAVIVGIPSVLGFIAYVLKRKREPARRTQIGTSSVNIIGSHNYVEGTTVNQKWDVEANKPSVKLRTDKRKFECTLRKTQIPNKQGLYYKFDFNNESFVLKAQILDGELSKKNVDRAQLKMGNKALVAILQQFMLFNEGLSAISISDNLFLHIDNELSGTDISLRVKVSASDLLAIPFQTLSNKDFGVNNHLFEIILEQ